MIKPWTALVPFKPFGTRKTRLTAQLNLAERELLSEVMFQHVIGILQTVPLITKTAVLCAHYTPAWNVLHILDRGRGLNEEIAIAQEHYETNNLLVIHADLPFVSTEDINILLNSCVGGGAALAPDRHEAGTNAIALSSAPGFPFAFGEASFQRHLALTNIPIQVVKRSGLALDIDTSADLDLALQQGFKF